VEDNKAALRGTHRSLVQTKEKLDKFEAYGSFILGLRSFLERWSKPSRSTHGPADWIDEEIEERTVQEAETRARWRRRWQGEFPKTLRFSI
jgi:hypothetical protein